jgi:hypothetical protein
MEPLNYSGPRWYALVAHEVVGPFKTGDLWYHDHAGPDWRYEVMRRTGIDPWRVARTELGDGREVSTVFLGLDHNFLAHDIPIVFETLVLPDGDGDRYATWDQAVAGHQAVVAKYREVEG